MVTTQSADLQDHWKGAGGRLKDVGPWLRKDVGPLLRKDVGPRKEVGPWLLTFPEGTRRGPEASALEADGVLPGATAASWGYPADPQVMLAACALLRASHGCIYAARDEGSALAGMAVPE